MSHQHEEDEWYYEIIITRKSFTVLSKCVQCKAKFKINDHGFKEMYLDV